MKMQDKIRSVAIQGFIGLKPEMHSFLPHDISEHKKAKGANINVVATIWVVMNINMYCWIINVWDIQWI